MREKLIELIASKECSYYSGTYEKWIEHDCEKCGAEYCSVTQLADHLIANGVTIQKWIPVTERLPDEYVSVLVCIPTEHPLPTVKEAYLANGCWATKMWIFDKREVTHWMPLPEPPKKAE